MIAENVERLRLEWNRTGRDIAFISRTKSRSGRFKGSGAIDKFR